MWLPRPLHNVPDFKHEASRFAKALPGYEASVLEAAAASAPDGTR